ncbi:MAG: hypothetical protein Kow0096_13220 [Thiohalomonadaceae bacterium]
MFELRQFFAGNQIRRDGAFVRTQFANTVQKDSFCFVLGEKYLAQANANPNITCVITNGALADGVASDKGLVLTDRPEEDFYRLHNELFKVHGMAPAMAFGVGKTAVIEPTATVSDKCSIGEGVYIGHHAVIADYSVIEDGAWIGPNTVIGADGHFFKRYANTLFKVEHAGGAMIGRNAQILAGAIVSKALHTDFTVVGAGTVVSVQAHVGHGCIIGSNTILAGNVQVSGYTTIGNDAWIGPSAVISNLLHVGDRVRVEIGSVVVKNVPDDGHVSGGFAMEHRKNLREYARCMK